MNIWWLFWYLFFFCYSYCVYIYFFRFLGVDIIFLNEMEMDEVENFEELIENWFMKEIKIYEFDDFFKIIGGFGCY